MRQLLVVLAISHFVKNVLYLLQTDLLTKGQTYSASLKCFYFKLRRILLRSQRRKYFGEVEYRKVRAHAPRRVHGGELKRSSPAKLRVLNIKG